MTSERQRIRLIVRNDVERYVTAFESQSPYKMTKAERNRLKQIIQSAIIHAYMRGQKSALRKMLASGVNVP